MAKTYLTHSNFNGAQGSHFFIALYYEVLNDTTVRFYAHAGSHDAYSAGGSSSAVYINGNYVGSISSLPANSDFEVGYLDVSGSGVVTATASCSTPWNGVGSTSTTGSVSVGPYITSFDIVPRDETSVIYSFTVSSTADYAWYSFDGVNWADMPQYGIVGGLIPGQATNFYLKVRQQATQAEYTAGPVVKAPYNYPNPTGTGNARIDQPLTVTVSNPLGRQYLLELISAENGATIGVYNGTANGNVTGFNDSNAIALRYASIPNARSGRYYARVTYGSSVKTWGYGTYTIIGDETPIVTTTAIDTGKTLDTGNVTTTLTGDNKKIIKFISDVQVDVTATAQNSATITNLFTQYGGYQGISGQEHIYNNVEGILFKGYARDSRELLNYQEASGLTLIPYVKLTLENIELYRDNQTSNTLKCKGDGDYFNDSFGSQNNSLTFKLRYKESSSSTWGSWSTKQMTIGSNNTYSFDFTVGSDLDYTKTYNFEFEIADKCMKITDTETAKPGIPVQGLFEDFQEAFGTKTFEKDSNGSTKLNIDMIYPIGSIYMSVNNTNPETLFGGTWEAIENRFLLGASSSYTAGSTGGQDQASVQMEMSTYNSSLYIDSARQDFTVPYNSNVRFYTGNSSLQSLVETQYYGFKVSNLNDTSKLMPPYLAVYMWKRTA